MWDALQIYSDKCFKAKLSWIEAYFFSDLIVALSEYNLARPSNFKPKPENNGIFLKILLLNVKTCIVTPLHEPDRRGSGCGHISSATQVHFQKSIR
jgi:hypothetical protein